MSNRTTITVNSVGHPVAGLLDTALRLTHRRSWIHDQLRRIILKSAVRDTFLHFAAEYPTWTACLFDEHFLTHRAAPLLACYIRSDIRPTALELATAWHEQFGPASMTIRSQRVAQFLPAAEYFLQRLEAELSRYSLFTSK